MYTYRILYKSLRIEFIYIKMLTSILRNSLQRIFFMQSDFLSVQTIENQDLKQFNVMPMTLNFYLNFPWCGRWQK